MENDPLAEPSECRCKGSGWIEVPEAWVRREIHERFNDDWSRAPASRNTVYPCHQHNPTAHRRWSEGHYNRDHIEGDCAECSGRRRRKSKRERAVPVPSVERKDFE